MSGVRDDEEPQGDEGAQGEKPMAPAACAGFKSFTAQERIESVPPSTRAVGQMMRLEAERLVSPLAREPSRAWGTFDVVHYSRLCERFHLPTKPQRLTAPKQKGQLVNKPRQGPALSVRERATARAAEQDILKIEGLKGALPRWEAAGNRWESYVVAFRMWLGQGEVSSRLDRVVSALNLRGLLREELAEADAPLPDLDDEIRKLVRGDTFRSVLEQVARKEESLVSPSFGQGWAGLRLYPEQLEVAELVLACLRKRLANLDAQRSEGGSGPGALLLRFCTPPSTGKSSAAAYLGALLHFFASVDLEAAKRRMHVSRSYVLYECYSESVRFDVAKTCVAAGVPFAIVSNGMACPSFCCYHSKPRKAKDPTPPFGPERVSHSFRLLDACDVHPVVLVCDPASAIGLLEERRKSGQRGAVGDVLLLDEPTAGLDARTTRWHAEILSQIPAITVLMSATLPEFGALPTLVAHARKFFGPDLELRSVRSERIVSPCTVVDAQTSVYGPQRLFCGTCSELAALLRRHLHLLRLFSPRAVLQLVGDIAPKGAAVLERLAPEDACDFHTIRGVALQLLDACAADALPLAGGWLEYAPLELQLICTSDSHLFAGTSIVLSEDEDGVWRRSLPRLLEGADKLSKRLAAREAALSKAEKIRVHAHSGRRETQASSICKERDSQVQRQRQEADMRADVAIPDLWPAACCVNSAEHHSRYAPRGAARDPTSTRAVPAVPLDILHGSCEVLVEGMLSGLCTLHSKFADAAFSLAGLELAEARSFSFLSGGRSAVYGVNLPCDRVILALDASRTSPETLAQSMGRCGRTGKYTRSEVLFASRELLCKVFDAEALAAQGGAEQHLDEALKSRLRSLG